ncbi:MAG TPA: SBBP repeat-containing protein, partial [Candidatus Krumholzibacteria bacterium]|nr:SBBP repeat-containing protein [Candidatus Krumholzibacteria bacterium]
QQARTVTVDSHGNSYFAGDFQGTINFTGLSQNTLTSVAGYDFYIAKFDAAGNFLWSQRFGKDGDQHVTSLATDPSGNLYVAGYFYGSMDLGDNQTMQTFDPVDNVFFAKFGPGGNVIWHDNPDWNLPQRARAIAADQSGNMYVAGDFQGQMGLGVVAITSAGGYDIFLAKYDSAGTNLWGKRFGDPATQTVASMTVDPSGNPILLGEFAGTINFGTGNMTSVGATDIGLAKFNPAGTCLWSHQYGTASAANPRSVATDPDGNVYIGGSFLCCIDFGGGFLFENGGGYDIFLAKLNPAGTFLWNKSFGDANWDDNASVATDVVGNVYLFGNFNGQLDFGGGALLSTPFAIFDPYLASLDADGNHRWSTAFPSGTAEAAAMACGGGEVCVTGSVTGSINLGGGVLSSSGQKDVFAAQYSRFFKEPVITSIADVGNDQGKKVWVELSRSGHDAPSSTPINHYEIYRKQEPGAGWDLVGSIPAHGEDEYLAIAPTLADSTVSNGQHFTTFFARAVTSNPLVYYDSPPASGYSLDNLAPAVPTNLIYQAGQLSWSKSKSSDFDHFTVYGANTSSFASAVLVHTTATNTMDVSSSPYTHYFVTATDHAGNESAPAMFGTATAVGDTPRSYALSISAYPNPFNPQTTLRYTLPAKGRVTITIYDTQGALVTRLIDETRNAGAYTVAWNGQNETGRVVSSGVYYARILNDSQARTCKLLLMK